MATIAYFDCPTGIAGDMCLGALVDLGVPLDYLIAQLQGLGIGDEFTLAANPLDHHGQRGIKVMVNLQDDHHPHHRHLPQIREQIAGANLPPKVTTQAMQVFETLAVAEGAVHGVPPEAVHFHEVGAVDALVDIVGSCLGLHWLGVEQVYCSALPTGSGTVKAAHGLLPVPVPAVLKLWENRAVPVYDNGLTGELVTPTGAALMVTLAAEFGGVPAMRLQKTGWGAGTKSFALPNLLRIWLGEGEVNSGLETVMVLATQIDDATPQAIAYAHNQLLTAGAFDVFTQAITMKKNRLGTLLTVICPPALTTTCEQILFTETPTLGIRRSLQPRHALNRRLETVNTPYGPVRVKLAYQGEQLLNIQPEYEDCRAIAQAQNLPWQTVHDAALAPWHNAHRPTSSPSHDHRNPD